jgi:chromosome segregation ATPase
VLDVIFGNAGRWFLVGTGTLLVLWSWDIPKKLVAAYRAATADPEERFAQVSGKLEEEKAAALALSEKIKFLEGQLERSESKKATAQAELAQCEYDKGKQKQQLESAEYGLKQYQLNVDMITGQREEALSRVENLSRDLYRHKLAGCGFTLKSKDLTVAVHYMDSRDRELAERIKREFGRMFTNIPWKATTIDNKPPITNNPAWRNRILLFTDDAAREGIAAALTELIGAEVVAWEDPAGWQSAGIEIIVFDHPVEKSITLS